MNDTPNADVMEEVTDYERLYHVATCIVAHDHLQRDGDDEDTAEDDERTVAALLYGLCAMEGFSSLTSIQKEALLWLATELGIADMVFDGASPSEIEKAVTTVTASEAKARMVPSPEWLIVRAAVRLTEMCLYASDHPLCLSIVIGANGNGRMACAIIHAEASRPPQCLLHRQYLTIPKVADIEWVAQCILDLHNEITDGIKVAGILAHQTQPA